MGFYVEGDRTRRVLPRRVSYLGPTFPETPMSGFLRSQGLGLEYRFLGFRALAFGVSGFWALVCRQRGSVKFMA